MIIHFFWNPQNIKMRILDFFPQKGAQIKEIEILFWRNKDPNYKAV